MKSFVFLLVAILFVSACGPSSEQVQKAIEETAIAGAAATAAAATVTFTPEPTATETPVPSITPTDVNDPAREEFTKVAIDELNQIEYLDHVESIDFADGVATVKVVSLETEKGEMSGAAHSIAVFVSAAFSRFSELELDALAKGKPFQLELVVTSIDGRYTYATMNDYEMITKLTRYFEDKGAYSFEDWEREAKGQFR